MRRWHELSIEARDAVIRENLHDAIAMVVCIVMVFAAAAAWRWL